MPQRGQTPVSRVSASSIGLTRPGAPVEAAAAAVAAVRAPAAGGLMVR